MSYDNTNKGVLFKNDGKLEKAETHDTTKWPDYQGKLDVEGHEYELAAWIREAKSGKKFMSLTIQEPRERAQPKPATPKPAADFDDDIPF